MILPRVGRMSMAPMLARIVAEQGRSRTAQVHAALSQPDGTTAAAVFAQVSAGPSWSSVIAELLAAARG